MRRFLSYKLLNRQIEKKRKKESKGGDSSSNDSNESDEDNEFVNKKKQIKMKQAIVTPDTFRSRPNNNINYSFYDKTIDISQDLSAVDGKDTFYQKSKNNDQDKHDFSNVKR